MKKIIGLIMAALILCAGSSFADLQWNGPETTTDAIYRTGNVGIGITSPLSNLHLYKGSSGLSPISTSLLTLENSSTAVLQFLTGTGGMQYLLFGTNSSNTNGWIRYVPNSGSPYMDFRVNAATVMTMKSDGNIGIGTTTPTAKLDVNGGLTSSELTLKAMDAVNEGGQIKFSGAGSYLPWYADIYQNYFRLINDGQEKFVVSNNGDVSIQNTSGMNSLSLKGLGDGVGAAEIKMIDATDNKFWIMHRRDNASSESNQLLFSFYDGSTWHSAINMTPTGYVGFGTSLPGAKLHITQGSSESFGVTQMLQTTGTGYDGPRICFVDDPSSGKSWTVGSAPSVSDAGFEIREDGNNAQWGTPRLKVAAGGNIGIGTEPATTERLSIGGNIMITDENNDIVKIGELGGGAGRFDFGFQGGASATQNMLFHGGDASNSWKMDNFTIQSSIISLAGNVGIGTANPGTYALAVNGSIRAKEVIVESGWSDFVFESNYKLRSLDELEKYIKTNKHLPDVPSEAEVKAKGVSIGDMQSKLLQKVEELTLYMIELKKENQELQKRVNALETK
jgi:hypothetical protein